MPPQKRTRRAAAQKAATIFRESLAGGDSDDKEIHQQDSEVDDLADFDDASVEREDDGELSSDEEKPVKNHRKKAKVAAKLKSNAGPMAYTCSTDSSIDPFENYQLTHGANPFVNFNEAGTAGFRKISNSLKDKLMHLFGFHQGRIVAALKLDEANQRNFFLPSLAQVESLNLRYLSNSINFPDNRVSQLSFDQYSSELKLYNTVRLTGFSKDDTTYTLKPGAATYLTRIDSHSKREIMILNAGGTVLDISWKLQTSTNESASTRYQYLALSITDCLDITDARFSVFGSGKDADQINALNIYEVDTHTHEISLLRSYLTRFGPLLNVKWMPFDLQENGILGMIGGVYADGKIRLIKIKGHDGKKFCELEEASLMVAIPDTRITCFDIISNHSIIFGTQDGHIGEYNFEQKSVSYLFPLITHGIDSVTSCFSDSYHDDNPVYIEGEYQLKDRTIVVSSVDLQLYVDLSDICNQKTEFTKTKTMVSHCRYISQAHLYVVNDGSRVTKVFPKRDCQLSINFIKSQTVSSALASSRLHSLVMVGSSDGEVFIADAVKRILPLKKSGVASAFPVARLMKVEYSANEDSYRINTTHGGDKVSGKEYDVPFQFNTPNVCINNISWNENPSTANWFAASTLAGLVVIERMLSVRTEKSLA